MTYKAGRSVHCKGKADNAYPPSALLVFPFLEFPGDLPRVQPLFPKKGARLIISYGWTREGELRYVPGGK